MTVKEKFKEHLLAVELQEKEIDLILDEFEKDHRSHIEKYMSMDMPYDHSKHSIPIYYLHINLGYTVMKVHYKIQPLTIFQ